MVTICYYQTAPQRAFSLIAALRSNQADLTSFANQAGLPAVSIPMLTKHILPAGMQIIGPKKSDNRLLQMAQDWQQASKI